MDDPAATEVEPGLDPDRRLRYGFDSPPESPAPRRAQGPTKHPVNPFGRGSGSSRDACFSYPVPRGPDAGGSLKAGDQIPELCGHGGVTMTHGSGHTRLVGLASLLLPPQLEQCRTEPSPSVALVIRRVEIELKLANAVIRTSRRKVL